MKYSLGFNEALQAQDRIRMFIDEQHAHHDLRAEYVSVEQVLWSPAANRHCCWTFPLGGNEYGKRLWGQELVIGGAYTIHHALTRRQQQMIRAEARNGS